MFKPSLITYTFYSSDLSKNERFEFLTGIDNQNRMLKPQMVNLTKGILAFNFVFGGDSVSVPIASDDDFNYSKELLFKRGIDAFRAGKKTSEGKGSWFYSGHALAISLVLSASENISISHDELVRSIKIIREDELEGHEFSGYITSEFSSVIDECGYSFEYLIDLKNRVEKL